ncbi:acyl-CoA dehydrogenase family protein [Alicyclobacillus acidoterrestris]|uniref:Acyl-CoA dehydrogenase family protein n=1 Tax=Alicyclobacillus acidoterrestris (strain ATCC 49025 / DSM 3922 / CIP 106132 / NCIMB 13137 / GD3B) TaxID=1356854 RepID=T0DT65_ALIAG|nr:acyl-CoA dehydrogenase family protein [Alicyclobacillus acidoterrestris]EPZ52661.1 acyl-CoA dehydrogenase [Alicyclobacillus acidoterrestris ATCC 49025]UNO48618.1 acyl-CoA dehydrogenase family protein [Alicyclobacillus acidoterrestris]
MTTHDFQQYQSLVTEYVKGPARAFANEIEQSGKVPAAVWDDLNDRGFLRLTAPRDYGGAGLRFEEYLQLLEQFAHMHGSMRVIVHVMNSLWRSLDSKATPEQRAQFVIPFVQGKHRVTFTLTEPNSGSGADIKTTARREGDEYVLNGEKWMIIFSDIADYFLLFCRLEGTSGGEGTMALLVPRDAPGLDIELMAPAMGITGTAHGHLRLRNCRVPVANRLGEEGDGLEVAFRGFLDPSRTAIGMTCVGAAAHALELAAQHAQTRVTFGKPLAQRQTIQMWLAEMATDIEAARQLCLAAARRFDEGLPISTQAAMAKLFGTEMLQRVTDKALQIHGGIGYFKSSEIERIYRDARMQRFEEGTSEIQKMVIVRDVLARAQQERSES